MTYFISRLILYRHTSQPYSNSYSCYSLMHIHNVVCIVIHIQIHDVIHILIQIYDGIHILIHILIDDIIHILIRIHDIIHILIHIQIHGGSRGLVVRESNL